MTTDLTYEERYPVLQAVSRELEKHIVAVLGDMEHVDRVGARAKSPDRYTAKSLKKDDDGNLKYDNPIFQIQDQIGARITVFYLTDVDRCKSLVEKYFSFIESIEKAPSKDEEFGYFGLHYILSMPDDVVPEGEEADLVPEFFELQIKTLFQHAWSEAHHDLGYKSVRDLTSDERRKVAFSAAQAWGADKMFAELVKTLSSNDNELSEEH